MIAPPGLRAWLGAGLWAALALPPARQALESTMTLQFLAQVPMLVLAGAWFAAALPRPVGAALGRWNGQGVAGALLASLAGLVWMLPRMMDASVNDGRFALAKFVSVPLLIGAPLALSWPRMGFVVRGVFVLELVATAFRLGWLYLASPERLCSNYLLGDQRLLGSSLLVLGAGACVVLFGMLMWGSVRTEPTVH